MCSSSSTAERVMTFIPLHADTMTTETPDQTTQEAGFRRTDGSTRRPRIAVIGTGGTFAMQARHRFDWIEYGDSGVVLPIDALIEQLGALDLAVEILPVPFRMLGSTAMTPSALAELAALIARTARTDPSIDGFIVTHGTATLEETAWFL